MHAPGTKPPVQRKLFASLGDSTLSPHLQQQVRWVLLLERVSQTPLTQAYNAVLKRWQTASGLSTRDQQKWDYQCWLLRQCTHSIRTHSS